MTNPPLSSLPTPPFPISPPIFPTATFNQPFPPPSNPFSAAVVPPWAPQTTLPAQNQLGPINLFFCPTFPIQHRNQPEIESLTAEIKQLKEENKQLRGRTMTRK
eukprot:CAMPEP_0201493640 /NCGR_PEP_ID=MMETSP0151_2-20130828/40176_1 /ASSEMBLY_ACC=CAM_ASM_000257 /TAXON_ID=200890 /ORGANISM="Paramoeba atlantica, Strain 621/1 / CCAP 1560/9" /LENGTH=103 /DNA_ID=CAMNT_0047881209 /DNA_START=154 /DNA_END=465 /DNA_ORIENTATION=+